jgi:peptidoglycan/xylan/chitin deacetylase (PgdA/CDA1 family)
MNPLHRAAANVRTTLLTPYRHAWSRWLASQSQAPISVLFYHRVANAHTTPWTISYQQFCRHIEYCDENYEMIDLAEVQRRVHDQDSRVPSVSITFDDGYRDNSYFALPLLIERGIPCTYFVTTSNVRNQTAFEHDRAAGKASAVNTVRQLREAADAGVEIGCHTRHHVDFSRIHDPAVVRNEIVEAKDELEQMIGKPVRYFAFPYGMPQHLTQVAIEMVSEAGFAGFCSAYGGYNIVGRDAFHIRRIHGDPEFVRLRNWLGFDRRKLKREPDVRYFLPPLRSFEETAASVSTDAICPTPAVSHAADPSCC